MAAEALVEEALDPHRRDLRLHSWVAQGGDVLRGGALGVVLNDRALEDRRVGRVDDREARDARIATDRRRPRHRAAPVMPDQGEAIDAEGVGEGEDVGDERVGAVGGDLLRAVAVAEAAQVGHDQAEAVGEHGGDFGPGAVRFGEAVEQDDGRGIGRAGERDVQRDPGREGEAALFGHKQLTVPGTAGMGMAGPNRSTKRNGPTIVRVLAGSVRRTSNAPRSW